MLLPHETLSCLSRQDDLFQDLVLGEPRGLTAFWRETAVRSPGFVASHPVNEIRVDPEHAVPIGIYGDDSGLFTNQKVLALLWGVGCSGEQHVGLQNSFRRYPLAAHHSWRDTACALQGLGLEFVLVSVGGFPDRDHNQRLFERDYYPDRAALALTPLTRGNHVGAF